MSDALIIALINLIATVGLDAAISIINGLKSAATLDDAIQALKDTQAKTAQDYLDEAKKNALPPTPPAPTPPTS